MKKSMRALSVMLCLGIAAGNLTACQNFTEEITVEQPQEASTQTTTTPESEEPQTDSWDEINQDALYSLYLDMSMNWLESIDSSTSRYFEYVELQEEFSLDKENYNIGSLSKYYIKDLNGIYQMLQEKETRDNLDEAFLALYPSMSELMEAIEKIYNYQDLKSYLDDDFAKGKEYHKELWNAYQPYTQNVGEFQLQFTQYSTERLIQDREEAQASGQTARYEGICALQAAIALEDEIDAQGLTNKNISTMNLEIMQSLYEEFLVHINAIIALPANNVELSENGILNATYWEKYIEAMKETKVSMTSLLQAAKNNQEITSFTDIPGYDTIPSYRAGLRDMINYYNKTFTKEN